MVRDSEIFVAEDHEHFIDQVSFSCARSFSAHKGDLARLFRHP